MGAGADDVFYDGVDSDCDGSDDFDQDEDGFVQDDDCDDLNPEVFPGAEEVADDVIDQDCDGEDLTSDDKLNLEGGYNDFRYKGGACGCSASGSSTGWGLLPLLFRRRRSSGGRSVNGRVYPTPLALRRWLLSLVPRF
jgi:hypothetical protein